MARKFSAEIMQRELEEIERLDASDKSAIALAIGWIKSNPKDHAGIRDRRTEIRKLKARIIERSKDLTIIKQATSPGAVLVRPKNGGGLLGGFAGLLGKG